MIAPGFEKMGELMTCFQVAKVTRPLLSVTKMTESGEITVSCRKDEEVILNKKNQVIARFPRTGGLYTCVMQVRNPRYQPFQRQAP